VVAQAAFGISVAFSFLAWGLVAGRYLWPALRRMPLLAAMRAILTLHAFRFVGLAFMVPGVVSPALPAGFARADAYGDLAAAVLAVLALCLLPGRAGVTLTWAFNVWGTVDLLNAFYEGNRFGLMAGQLGAAYFIVTMVVPLLLITHGVMFALLLRRQAPRESRNASIANEQDAVAAATNIGR
jgi:hypothetical protein